MGYRLEICDEEGKIIESGRKFYGYQEESELHTYKSWNWLKERGFVDENDIFSYGFWYKIPLIQSDFKEFIELYICDFNSVYENGLSISDFEESLKQEKVYLLWG